MRLRDLETRQTRVRVPRKRATHLLQETWLDIGLRGPGSGMAHLAGGVAIRAAEGPWHGVVCPAQRAHMRLLHGGTGERKCEVTTQARAYRTYIFLLLVHMSHLKPNVDMRKWIWWAA